MKSNELSQNVKADVSQNVRMLNGQTFIFDSDGRICCPNCGCASLHFSEPETSHPSDSAYMTIRIKVECEVCHLDGRPFVPPFVLDIYSGKGQASMEWESFR